MVVSEGIRKGLVEGIDFGDYSIKDKLKVDNFEVEGHTYYIKTHAEVTRLEKDGNLLIETVPGASIQSFVVTNEETNFDIVGQGSTMVTIELEEEAGYRIYVEDVYIDRVTTNVSGKLSFSMELTENLKHVRIEKIPA